VSSRFGSPGKSGDWRVAQHSGGLQMAKHTGFKLHDLIPSCSIWTELLALIAAGNESNSRKKLTFILRSRRFEQRRTWAKKLIERAFGTPQ